MTTKRMQARRLGRPDALASEALNARIMDSAAELFVKQGYGATSVEQIALAAGVGKQTIYRRFPSKEELFRTVLASMAGRLGESAGKDGRDAADPLARLREVCSAGLARATCPEIAALFRVLVTEAPRFPALAEQGAAVALDLVHAPIRRLLTAARDAGQIRADCDIDDAAKILTGLVNGWPLYQAMLGRDRFADDAARRSYFDRAWTIFLNGAANAR